MILWYFPGFCICNSNVLANANFSYFKEDISLLLYLGTVYIYWYKKIWTQNCIIIIGFVYYDPTWAIPCCGVVTGWKFKSASPAGWASLPVWEDINYANGDYRMIGENVFQCRLLWKTKCLNELMRMHCIKELSSAHYVMRNGGGEGLQDARTNFVTPIHMQNNLFNVKHTFVMRQNYIQGAINM